MPVKNKGRKNWVNTRRAWFKEHPADSYECYICEAYIPKEETTLDHVKPRGSHPGLRYVLSNLEPACALCQFQKGSKSLQAYINERDAHGEPVSAYARSLLS